MIEVGMKKWQKHLLKRFWKGQLSKICPADKKEVMYFYALCGFRDLEKQFLDPLDHFHMTAGYIGATIIAHP